MVEKKASKPAAKASVVKDAKKSKAKAEVKSAEPVKKTDAKVEKKTEVKATPGKKNYIQKVKKANVKKSTEALEAQKMLKSKKKHPTFRGRFGKRNIRRKSKAKWNKWRKSHGIDLDRGLQHGYRPKVGYGNPAEIKGVHASGYREVRVENVADLEKINPKTEAARIGAAVGKKKRNDIVTIANEKNIRILN